MKQRQAEESSIREAIPLARSYVLGYGRDCLSIKALGLMIPILMEFRQSKAEEALVQQAVQRLSSATLPEGLPRAGQPWDPMTVTEVACVIMGLQPFDNPMVVAATEWLKASQRADGNWGSTEATLLALESLWGRQKDGDHLEIKRGLDWLSFRQADSGEFPCDLFPGCISSTAQAFELLYKWSNHWRPWKNAGRMFKVQRNAFEHLLSQQKEDGSWGGSVAETCLALSALSFYGCQLPQERFRLGFQQVLSSQREDGSFPSPERNQLSGDSGYEGTFLTTLTAIKAMERYLLLLRHPCWR